MSPAEPVDVKHKALFTSIHQFASELFTVPWKVISIMKFATSFEIKCRPARQNSIPSRVTYVNNQPNRLRERQFLLRVLHIIR